MIAEGANEPTLKRYAREKGMERLLKDGKEKLRSGITSYKELVSVIH